MDINFQPTISFSLSTTFLKQCLPQAGSDSPTLTAAAGAQTLADERADIYRILEADRLVAVYLAQHTNLKLGLGWGNSTSGI